MNKFLKIFFAVAMLIFFGGCGEATDKPAMTEEIFPKFTSTDLNGNQVTDKIFSKKKITVVNIWGTFCPPCIGEMPELGAWAKNISDDAQLIGIVLDVKGAEDSATISDAKKILSEADANFVNIVPSNDLAKYLEKVEAVPTTVFVDSNGKIIGESVIGADVDQYKQRVKEFLHE